MEQSNVRVDAAIEMRILKTSSAPAQLDDEQSALAHELMQRHGNVRVAREVHGLHFYIACPECLQNDGEKELFSMHLAINVERWSKGHASSAQCMKTGKVYRIDELTFAFPPLEQRGYQTGPPRIADQTTPRTPANGLQLRPRIARPAMHQLIGGGEEGHL